MYKQVSIVEFSKLVSDRFEKTIVDGLASITYFKDNSIVGLELSGVKNGCLFGRYEVPA